MEEEHHQEGRNTKIRNEGERGRTSEIFGEIDRSDKSDKERYKGE